MKTLVSLLIATLLITPGAFAQSKKSAKKAQPVQSKTINMGSQFDSLGSNEEIVKKAQAIQPANSMRIVQKREVDRVNRLEIGGSYGMVNGADSYVDTANWGAQIDYHINPRWSLGVRYYDSRNQLTNEGKRVYEDAKAKQAANLPHTFPDIDYQLSSYMAVVNWYPIYGKVSWLESSVSQFDFYFVAGGGQTKLNSNTTSPIYTGGAGVGIWWNNRITSRLEVRYENYKDQVVSGKRSIDSVVAQIGIGFML